MKRWIWEWSYLVGAAVLMGVTLSFLVWGTGR